MKALLFFSLLSTIACALPVQFSTFSADFEQRITDEDNTTLRYKGTLKAVAPSKALWNYTEPVEKQVLVEERKVTLLEPDLEQAVIRRIDADLDFFSLLEKALPLGEGRYKAEYRSTVFILHFNKEMLEKITYLDDFDNNVSILFSAQRQNAPLDPATLILKIPSDYDIIRD